MVIPLEEQWIKKHPKQSLRRVLDDDTYIFECEACDRYYKFASIGDMNQHLNRPKHKKSLNRKKKKI